MKKVIYSKLIAIVLCITNFINAQIQTPLDLSLRQLEQQRASLGLLPEDIKDLAVSDMYRSSHNGVTHVYLQQRYEGIEIHNAIVSYHVTED